MSTAACVTPLWFRFKAFTVFTPSFSLNLGNKLIHILSTHIGEKKKKRKQGTQAPAGMPKKYVSI